MCFSLIRELTERIVLVLSRMKCPYVIEPHQIPGNDFIHIYPVVQWLVKKVFERRAETGDFNRAYTLNQYDKKFGGSIEEVKAFEQSINWNEIFCIDVDAIIIHERKCRRYSSNIFFLCAKMKYIQWICLDSSSTTTSFSLFR